MKRTLLAVLLALLSSPVLAATCPVSNAQMKDNNGVTFNVVVVDSGDGSGNCLISNKVSNVNANGQQNMANSSPVVIASNQSVADPCTFQAKIQFPVATTASNLQLFAPSGSTKIYICSAHFIVSSAANLSIIEGTGAACTSSNEHAVFGSTTASQGEAYAANGGMTYGNGGGTVGFTSTAGNGLCLLQNTNAPIAGNITAVQQ